MRDKNDNSAYAANMAELLTAYRIAAGLTIEEVAFLMDFSAGYAFHLFRGSRLPSIENAARLAALLNIPADALLDAVRQDKPEGPQQERRRKRVEAAIARKQALTLDARDAQSYAGDLQLPWEGEETAVCSSSDD